MNYQRHSASRRQPNKRDAAKQIVKSHTVENTIKQFEDNSQVDEQYEGTMTKPLVVPKIKISFDEEQTKKIGWQKGISALAKPPKQSNTQKKIVVNAAAKIDKKDEPVLEIPYNKKVEQIMNKKPLRERLQGLLPPELQLPISFDHQQILKRMQLIDRTIQFLGTHRSIKIFFFDTIRKSIYQTSSVLIQLRLLQQILFLDQNSYQIQWKMNQKIKRYDIKITLPKIDSMDLRKGEMRQKIVKYLIYKQGEFLAEKKLTKIDNFKWHQDFDYRKVQIPQKSLPIHPNQLSSDIRAFPDEQIDKIGNPALKMLLKNKKNVSEVKSFSSVSIADMIFSKVSASQISNHILSLIKQKQKANNEVKQQQKQEGLKIDKQAILKIYDEILLIYMSKNVSNIFKVTLIELLQQRLQLKNEMISEYVQKMLKLQGMTFLKVIQSSKKVDVVQIDKNKYKEVRNLVSSASF